jgi:hypothetical protein
MGFSVAGLPPYARMSAVRGLNPVQMTTYWVPCSAQVGCPTLAASQLTRCKSTDSKRGRLLPSLPRGLGVPARASDRGRGPRLRRTGGT